MWKHSTLSRCMPFFWKCNTRMMSCMLPSIWECSIRFSAYLEVWLLCMKEQHNTNTAPSEFLYNRLNSYQLHEMEYHREENIVNNILHNNSFPVPTRKPKIQFDPPSHNTLTRQKWTTFTYTGPEATYITRLFKHTNLKIAYHTSHNMQSYLAQNTHIQGHFRTITSL